MLSMRLLRVLEDTVSRARREKLTVLADYGPG